MIKKDCLYIPDPTEPSIFTTDGMSISLDWVCWMDHYKKTGVKTTDYIVTPDVVFDNSKLPLNDFAELYNISVQTHVLITHALKEHSSEYILPQKPPPMYVSGSTDSFKDNKVRKTVSMAWVIDTCIRDNMTPQEATLLALALSKM